MKECNLKNIIGGIFSILIIFLGSFTVKAEIPNLEDSLVDTQRGMYNSLSLSSQNEIKDFYRSLGDTLQKRYHRHNRGNDFVEFLRKVDNFLNSEINQQVKVKKAYIIGIANLKGGSYIINARHLKIFTLKSKSSINGGFSEIGYRSIRDNRIQNFFGDLLGSYSLFRQWTIREKLYQKPMPKILSPNPVSQNPPPFSIFSSVVSGDSLSIMSVEGAPTIRQDTDFSFDFEQDTDSLWSNSEFSFDDKNIDFFNVWQ